MFNLIDMIIVRPIVNILFVTFNFVGDFGLAIIIFTVVVKLLTWPIMKNQLRQTKLMREIQPELAEIKKNCKGNKQLESIQMMDLYKRKNIKPFRSMLMIFIQLPIFIALFTAINVTVAPTTQELGGREYNVEHSAYSFVEPLDRVHEVIELQTKYFEQQKEDKDNAVYEFEPKLFGVVDLSVRPGFNGLSPIIILVFALISAALQFVVARQNDPSRQKKGKRKTMKELMKEAADGKEASQEDINAVAQGQMAYMMPIMMLFIMINLPGAVVFYYMLTNIITVISSYNHLTNEQKVKFIDEGTILPVRYKTIEIEKKNGQKYSKKGYVFEEIIPLFSFMNELKLINTAPLQIESVLKSSQMNDEITRILKEEIAQLYYFKSRNKKNNTQNGFKRKVFVTEEGKELTPKEWSEKNIECKKEDKKNFLKGYWKYITRRSIDSMIKDCKFTTTNGEILNAYNEKSIDRKTYSRFIDSVITFLRYSKNISYGQDKYIKDFILYDKKGNIVKDSDFRTENERLKIAEQIKNKILAKEKLSNEKEIPPEIKKKITKKIRQETGTNPSIDKIDIIIS